MKFYLKSSSLSSFFVTDAFERLLIINYISLIKVLDSGYFKNRSKIK